MINPIIELFNVTDSNGVPLSDYSLVFTDAGAITNTPAFIFGRLLAEPIYIVMLTLLAPAIWVVNFITDPSQLTRILVDIGSKISSKAFAVISPLALGTLGFMLLAFRLLILPRREAAKKGGGGPPQKQKSVRVLGKTGYTFESTVMRGIGKDARKKPLDQLAAALILIIVSVIFTQRPFLVLQKLLEWAQRIIADLTGQSGTVASPMMSLVRGLTWIINFGGAIPENCDRIWAAAMQSGNGEALQSCLGPEQAANMTPSFVTAFLAALALAIGWIVLKFNWAFLKQATWFLAVVVWESILIPYLALRTIFQPNRNNGRGSLDDILAIFRIIITYLCYFIGIVFLASVLPSALIGALQGIDANAIVQVAALGAVYWAFGKYVIPNIKPGATLFGTTMLGEKAPYDGWGDWREHYWENPDNRPADIFNRLGLEQFPGSPQFRELRRQRQDQQTKSGATTANRANTKGGPVLSEADQRSVDNMREKPTIGSATSAKGRPATKTTLGDGITAPAATIVSAAVTPAAVVATPTATSAAVAHTTAATTHTDGDPAATTTAAPVVLNGATHLGGAPTTGHVDQTGPRHATNNNSAHSPADNGALADRTIRVGDITIVSPFLPPAPAADHATAPTYSPTPADDVAAAATDQALPFEDRAQRLLADHQRVTEQRIVHVHGDAQVSDPREMSRDAAALRINRPGATSLYEAIRRWGLHNARTAAGDIPGTPSAAPATVTDTTSAPSDFVAAAATDRHHRRLIADAQAKGINLDAENDSNPPPRPSFWHDSREGDIGIRFLRRQGFGDRI